MRLPEKQVPALGALCRASALACKGERLGLRQRLSPPPPPKKVFLFVTWLENFNFKKLGGGRCGFNSKEERKRHFVASVFTLQAADEGDPSVTSIFALESLRQFSSQPRVTSTAPKRVWFLLIDGNLLQRFFFHHYYVSETKP